MKNTKICGVWRDMRSRCNRQKDSEYHNYGGRGIIVCERWKNFINFYADMGDPPKGLTLDRIDNDGNYEPSNCRWATRKAQNNNSRQNVIIEYQGQKHTISQWANKINISYRALYLRLRTHKWSIKRALTQSMKKRTNQI